MTESSVIIRQQPAMISEATPAQQILSARKYLHPPAQQHSMPVRNGLEESRSRERVGDDPHRGSRRIVVADASGDSRAADGSPSLAAHALDPQLTSGGGFSSPMMGPRSPSGSSAKSRNDLRRRRRKAERESLEMPSKSDPAVTDRTGTSGTSCCYSSCWFACDCVCHTGKDTPGCVSEEEEIDEVGTTESCIAKSGKGSRQGREPWAALSRSPGAHTPGEHTPREHTPRKHTLPEHTPREHTSDVYSAFLATSECGRGPRAIRFGTAARYPSLRPDGGGTSAGARGRETNERTRISEYNTRWVTPQIFCVNDAIFWVNTPARRGRGGGGIENWYQEKDHKKESCAAFKCDLRRNP